VESEGGVKKETRLGYKEVILFFLIPLFFIIAFVWGLTEKRGIFYQLFFFAVYILAIGYIYFKKQTQGSPRSTIIGTLIGLVVGIFVFILVSLTLFLIGATESLQFTETTAYTVILLSLLLPLLFPVFGGILGYKWEKRKRIFRFFLLFLGTFIVLTLILLIRGYYRASHEEPELDCYEAGGQWGGQLSDIKYCVYLYSDGGAYCTHSDQCEGDCITNIISNLNVEGFCEYNNDGHRTDCYNTLENEHFNCRMDDIGFTCEEDSWDLGCDDFLSKGALEK